MAESTWRPAEDGGARKRSAVGVITVLVTGVVVAVLMAAAAAVVAVVLLDYVTAVSAVLDT